MAAPAQARAPVGQRMISLQLGPSQAGSRDTTLPSPPLATNTPGLWSFVPVSVSTARQYISGKPLSSSSKCQPPEKERNDGSTGEPSCGYTLQVSTAVVVESFHFTSQGGCKEARLLLRWGTTDPVKVQIRSQAMKTPRNKARRSGTTQVAS